MRETSAQKQRAMDLRRMDNIVRAMADDEELFETWLAYGVPDGADGEMLLEIAANKEAYDEIVHTFISVLNIVK